MKARVSAVLFTAVFLTASLTAQQGRTKRVWTNDDFPSAHETAKPEVSKAQPTPAVANTRTPKTTEELEARLELRAKWATGLKAALQGASEELPHATTQEQRHALLTKIKMIERDLEDTGAEIQQLQASLTR